jgi:hypothetical protein
VEPIAARSLFGWPFFLPFFLFFISFLTGRREGAHIYKMNQNTPDFNPCSVRTTTRQSSVPSVCLFVFFPTEFSTFFQECPIPPLDTTTHKKLLFSKCVSAFRRNS